MDEHKAWFNGLKNNKNVQWFIYHEDNGQAAGVVGFTDINMKSKNASWGFYAGSNAKKGIGFRMEIEALNYAFDTLRLHKLNCEVLATNMRVVSLHEKFGFIREGLFRQNHFNGEGFVDVVRLGLLSEEWNDKKVEILEKAASFK